MTATVTRWEWRTFGGHFGEVDAHFDTLPSSGPVESEELYFLSPTGENVKVRDGLLDIKVLREIDPVGLERWEPVAKSSFPLSTTDVAFAFEALRQPLPTLGRDSYTLDQFVAELIEPASMVRAVPVRKRRVRYTVHGCHGELSELEAAGRTTRTLAIETDDRAALWAAVTALGLREQVNTSFPEGLMHFVDEAAPRYAVIDCGTNSIKFHIGERGHDGAWNRIVDRAEITRLGEGMADTATISPEAIERTAVALKSMADEARDHHARVLVAVGTAGLRLAENRDDVIGAIEAATGIEILVISGEDESRLAYLAARASLGAFDGSLVVVDTGGGSTQFTFGDGARVDQRFSLDVGSVRYTERFGLGDAVSPKVLQQALDAIATDLGRLDGHPVPDAMVGMGGAITNITAVHLGLATYDPDRVQGALLDRSELDRQIELYRSRDIDDRRAIVGLQPKRADVILAGACIVRTVMDMLGQTELTVSDRGLRHGVLVERFTQP
jgi:exopolyphosphatase/guanosine-5'-triphosphate,3'-diphosphate pyrophosphatase